MESYIVDRIENNLVICEDDNSNIIEIEISKIDGIVHEGDVLVEEGESNYKVSREKTKIRKDYIKDLTKGMWNE